MVSRQAEPARTPWKISSPSSPSREIFLGLEGESRQSNDDSCGEEERLNDDTDLVERDHDTHGVGLHNGLDRDRNMNALKMNFFFGLFIS